MGQKSYGVQPEGPQGGEEVSDNRKNVGFLIVVKDKETLLYCRGAAAVTVEGYLVYIEPRVGE